MSSSESPPGGPTAVDQAYDAVLAFVDSLPGGGQLPSERTLAARLGVSRSTLRTAVDRLARLGLIDVRHGSGAVVRPHSDLSVDLPYREILGRSRTSTLQLFELRRILEPRLAGLAAKRRTQVEGQNIAQLAAASTLEFYTAVADASHNAPAAELVRYIVGVLSAPDQGTPQGAALDLLRNQRLSVSSAIIAGDAEAARDAMSTHLRTLARPSRRPEDD